MEIRMYEIRDRATFIPVIAIRLVPASEKQRYLLARAGYGTTPGDQGQYVLLCEILGGHGAAQSDPYGWNDRTMATAHLHIAETWPPDGAVVDVEYILSETAAPKESEATC
jgi:putative copper export protein